MGTAVLQDRQADGGVGAAGVNRLHGCPRKAWLASLAAALLLAALLTSGCGQQASAPSSASPSSSPSAAGYRILDEQWVSDEHYAIYKVLVPAGSSRRDLRRIAHEVVAKAKRGMPFCFLWVFFYDYAELTEHGGPPLGSVRYGGSTRGRSPTEAGDYAEMDYSYYLTHRNWDRRPSRRDAVWWSYWQKRYWRGRSHGKDIPDARLTRATARHFGVSTAAVRAAVARVDAWVTQSGGRIW